MTGSRVHQKGVFSLVDLIRAVRGSEGFSRAGAIGIFIGVVRGETSAHEKVTKLELEAHEDKANEVLAAICNKLKMADGIVDVQIHHMLGEFEVSDELVYVAVAGAHRNDVLPTLQEAVEQYKRNAPIFKKEHRTSKCGKTESYWVGEGKRGE